MSCSLSDSARPLATRWCVARPQKEQYLLYNSRTDEMHLVPVTGYYVYQLCDGLRSVAELEEELSQALGTSREEVQPVLRRFLSELLDRGVLELST
ncbi:MAG: PqqD family protein [Candidatus Competibacteraceae bacterium]|nr:PqqD family protein [Candidatus Competibacteraceae bacterium]